MATARGAKEIPDLWHHFLYIRTLTMSTLSHSQVGIYGPPPDDRRRHYTTTQNSVSWESRWCI